MSKYLVSARKYRPASFEQLVGQEHISHTLKNALSQAKLAHAFLFCGPRGVGKTTTARILAKVINCLNPQNDGIDPCNDCNSCKSFNENASFNILELDAASNNSVEHIRNLIEQVRFQPQTGNYKVFIIDEVHMLTSQAFNAFLKTLEEPPSHVKFILATTEKHKILPTILSRCQIFDFKRIQTSDIVSQLVKINTEESRTAEPEALHLIASKSDGAMRDALSIYDKIASTTTHITYKDVVASLNVLDFDYFFMLTDALLQKDLVRTLTVLNEIIQKGFEPEQVVEGLSEHIRNLLMCKDPRTLSILDAGKTLLERYSNQAMSANHSFLLSSLHLLNQCDISLPRANNKRLYTEIALSKICYLSHKVTENQIEEKKTKVVNSDSSLKSDQIESKPAKAEGSEAPVTSHTMVQNRTESNQDPIKENLYTELPKVNEKNESQKISDESVPDSVINTPVISDFSNLLSKIKSEEIVKKSQRQQLSLDTINKIWEDYLTEVGSKSIKAYLRMAIKSLDKKMLVVYVPNEINRNSILQETVLIEKIRNETGIPDLLMDVRIDPAQFPGYEETPVKKVLSTKEKYTIMKNINPVLEDLRIKFDLKVDKPV
ncbi:MAG TPA: DNA polymerase III subunit gamma/tau [Saprospiraceae bacterium]|nr:DNA polymerase III subunit gamma/tau [Saprospiraceae bacterium]